ncbi:MAG TPA: alpha/beta hydrolase [Polyangiaceae bacterium]|nr:alpha/beta hydrolase [Polyangiaceae bacterium]
MSNVSAKGPISPPSPGTIVTRDGETLYCRDVGHGPPVVLVHAWGLSHRAWQYQTGALQDAGLRTLSYDRRGHGRSSPAASGYDYDTAADDLDAVLDQRGVQRAVLVGHSQGCADIIRYLSRYGSARVRSVVLIAPLAPILLQNEDNTEGLPLAAFEQLWASWRHDFAEWVEAGKRPFFMPDTPLPIMDWVAGLLLETHLDVLLATSRTAAHSDLLPDLQAVDVPCLVIHGDRDVSAPLALGQRTAEGIRDARLAIYQNAPHGLLFTHTERLNRELIEFAHLSDDRKTVGRANGDPPMR